MAEKKDFLIMENIKRPEEEFYDCHNDDGRSFRGLFFASILGMIMWGLLFCLLKRVWP